MLRELGWIESTGNRPTPRNSESKLYSEDALYRRSKDLLALRKKPALFISAVFKSDEEIWVSRCASLIVDK